MTNDLKEYNKAIVKRLAPLIESDAFRDLEEASKRFCMSKEFKEYLIRKGDPAADYELEKLESKGYPWVISCDAAYLRRQYEVSKND
jgi:hypothetical protein